MDTRQTPSAPGGGIATAPVGDGSPSAPPPCDVSVVIPTYNNPSGLAACLRSLSEQDFPLDRFEIVIVDDGSAPEAADAVQRLVAGRERVRCIRQDNRGPAAARNHGAREAVGGVLMFTDDDCEPESNWVSEMYRPFVEASRGIVAVKGAYRTRQTSVIARLAQMEFETRYRKLLEEEHIDFVDTYSAAFKRDVFLSLGGFDTSFPLANNEDVEFSYRMAAKGFKMVFNPDAVVYHQHPDTLVKYLRVKFGRAYWRMAVYRKFPEKMRSDSYTPQTLKLQIVLSFLSVACLAGAIVDRRFVAPACVSLAAFVLSSLPFLLRVLDLPILNRVGQWLGRVLKGGSLRRSIERVGRAIAASPVGVLVSVLRRLARFLFRGVRSALRAVFGSRLFRACLHGMRRVAEFLVNTVLPLALRGLWWLVCLPWRLLRLLFVGLGRLRRTLVALPAMQRLRVAVDRVLGTRAVMVPLSLVLLFLRATVMGLGILWALPSRRANKGRFSQLLLIAASDVLGIGLACVAVFYTKLYFMERLLHLPDLPMGLYLSYLPFLLLFFLTVFFLTGLYRPYRGLSQINEFVLLTKAVFSVTVAVILLLYITGAPHSKAAVLLLFFFTLFAVATLRWCSRCLFNRLSSSREAEEPTRVLIVGTAEIARLICQKIERAASMEAKVMGFVSEDPNCVGELVDGHRVIGSFADLARIVEDGNVQEVFVALPMMPQEEVIDLIDKIAGKEGIHFYVISSLFDLVSAEIDIAEHNNIPIAYLKNETMQIVQVMVKRGFDLVVSVIVILLTFPFWLLIMVAIKLESDGPAMFRQERVGRNGKVFSIFKFRTMFADAAKYEYSPSRPGDERVTKVGRFLRKTSLDEFPQFINILKGEMSLVGPRPEMPFIVDTYTDWQRRRLKAKPGLTGLWQIMGRKDLPLHETLEYDFYYIKNQSLLLDLTILIKTVPVILKGKGAY